ncbi:MAG: rhodanese-like domain-containing protein [Actinobacteria bacterium]|nr:rhodanese-like domain-containing protein [Actinomycetota bacterium]
MILEPASIRQIARQEVQASVADGTAVIVDALSPMSFAVSHLPHAVNMPPERVDELAERLIPDRTTQVVVYCSSETCDASILAAKRLAELGYANVSQYAGGKRDWVEAGLPLEGGGIPRS